MTQTAIDLSAYVPDISYFENYQPREFKYRNKVMTDIEIIETAVKRGINAALFGPTGPGKTSSYYAVHAKNRWPLGVVNANGMVTVEDFVGQVMPTDSAFGGLEDMIEEVVEAKMAVHEARTQGGEKGGDVPAWLAAQRRLVRAELELDIRLREGANGLVWEDGLLPKFMQGDGRPCSLLVDEVNFAPPKIMAVLNGVTDDRRSITITQHHGQVITAHDLFHFSIAYNPDYEGTRPLNKAFRDRFPIKLEFDYDEELEKKIVKDHRLVSTASRIRVMVREGSIETPVTTRMLKQFEVLEGVYGREFAIANFLNNFEGAERSAIKNVAELQLRGGGAGTTGTGGLGGSPDVT